MKNIEELERNIKSIKILSDENVAIVSELKKESKLKRQKIEESEAEIKETILKLVKQEKSNNMLDFVNQNIKSKLNRTKKQLSEIKAIEMGIQNASNNSNILLYDVKQVIDETVHRNNHYEKQIQLLQNNLNQTKTHQLHFNESIKKLREKKQKLKNIINLYPAICTEIFALVVLISDYYTVLFDNTSKIYRISKNFETETNKLIYVNSVLESNNKEKQKHINLLLIQNKNLYEANKWFRTDYDELVSIYFNVKSEMEIKLQIMRENIRNKKNEINKFDIQIKNLNVEKLKINALIDEANEDIKKSKELIDFYENNNFKQHANDFNIKQTINNLLNTIEKLIDSNNDWTLKEDRNIFKCFSIKNLLMDQFWYNIFAKCLLLFKKLKNQSNELSCICTIKENEMKYCEKQEQEFTQNIWKKQKQFANLNDSIDKMEISTKNQQLKDIGKKLKLIENCKNSIISEFNEKISLVTKNFMNYQNEIGFKKIKNNQLIEEKEKNLKKLENENNLLKTQCSSFNSSSKLTKNNASKQDFFTSTPCTINCEKTLPGTPMSIIPHKY